MSKPQTEAAETTAVRSLPCTYPRFVGWFQFVRYHRKSFLSELLVRVLVVVKEVKRMARRLRRQHYLSVGVRERGGACTEPRKGPVATAYKEQVPRNGEAAW